MRVVLFGDGVWAVNCLHRLLKEGHAICAVILRRNPSDPTLGYAAADLQIPVSSPDRVNNPTFLKWILEKNPDLNLSISYDQIIRKPLLEVAPKGFINLHAGKLPSYRGRNVINWALINNEQQIGLTAHYMDEGIDTGDIIVQNTLPLTDIDTYSTVLSKVQEGFPDLLSAALRKLCDPNFKAIPQRHDQGFYVGGRIYGDEWIDWKDTSLNIYNKIRAISRPAPGARTEVQGITMLIWAATYDPSWPVYIATPGEIVGITPAKKIKVKTGDSTLIIDEWEFDQNTIEQGDLALKIGARLGHDQLKYLAYLEEQIVNLRTLINRLHNL